MKKLLLLMDRKTNKHLRLPDERDFFHASSRISMHTFGKYVFSYANADMGTGASVQFVPPNAVYLVVFDVFPCWFPTAQPSQQQ